MARSQFLSSEFSTDETSEKLEEDEAQVQKVAREHRVQTSRYLVLVLLLLACGTVASLTYVFLRRDDYDNYVDTVGQLMMLILREESKSIASFRPC